MLDAASRTLRARIAANTRASRTDGASIIAPAKAGWKQKWLDEVDPEGVLPVEERERRAKAAEAAHMCQLRLKRRKGGKGDGKSTDA